MAGLTAKLPFRSTQGFVLSPGSNAPSQSITSDANSSCPFLQWEGDVIMGQIAIGGGIVRLLNTCCPSTIIGHVAPVVINPIQRMLRRRPSTYISNKYFKRCSPIFIHSDSAPTVSTIESIPNIETTTLSGEPYSIFRILGHVMFSPRIESKAPATSSIPSYQAGASDGCFVAACAFAYPGGLFPSISRSFQNYETTEMLPNSINKFSHTNSLIDNMGILYHRFNSMSRILRKEDS